MPGDVFLVPADAGNYDRTVASAISPSTHRNPPEPLPDSSVRVWGVRAGSRSEQVFETMASGDLVLFYRSGRYVGVGSVGLTFEDEDRWVSRMYWGGTPATHVYTVEEFTKLDVPKEIVNRLFEYDPAYAPQGLTRVESEGTPPAEVRATAVEASVHDG